MNRRCHAGCKGRCWEDTARLAEVEGVWGERCRAEESQKETGPLEWQNHPKEWTQGDKGGTEPTLGRQGRGGTTEEEKRGRRTGAPRKGHSFQS